MRHMPRALQKGCGETFPRFISLIRRRLHTERTLERTPMRQAATVVTNEGIHNGEAAAYSS
jgi:hypothetical protein